ncbi:hypothetical protein GF377_04160, partial [candidate division GN15 bacterium]|nr:hypothetical protein [candidate division GN15 bacterium]
MKTDRQSTNRFSSLRSLPLILLLSLLATAMIGCDDDDEVWDPIPATPQGVYSITGDEVVWVYWNGIYERDVREYIVYRSLQPTTNYVETGRVAAVDNPDLDLLIYEFADVNVSNGQTYYYAVSAVDAAGQVSALSAEDVFDTPRPEGTVTLFPHQLDASLAGFNFASNQIVNYTSVAADVFVDSVGGTFYLNADSTAPVADIQDMGYT